MKRRYQPSTVFAVFYTRDYGDGRGPVELWAVCTHGARARAFARRVQGVVYARPVAGKPWDADTFRFPNGYLVADHRER